MINRCTVTALVATFMQSNVQLRKLGQSVHEAIGGLAQGLNSEITLPTTGFELATFH